MIMLLYPPLCSSTVWHFQYLARYFISDSPWWDGMPRLKISVNYCAGRMRGNLTTLSIIQLKFDPWVLVPSVSFCTCGSFLPGDTKFKKKTAPWSGYALTIITLLTCPFQVLKPLSYEETNSLILPSASHDVKTVENNVRSRFQRIVRRHMPSQLRVPFC